MSLSRSHASAMAPQSEDDFVSLLSDGSHMITDELEGAAPQGPPACVAPLPDLSTDFANFAARGDQGEAQRKLMPAVQHVRTGIPRPSSSTDYPLPWPQQNFAADSQVARLQHRNTGRPTSFGPWNANQHVETPTKGILKNEVDELTQHLSNMQQAAYQTIENQQSGFQQAAEQFQLQARDVRDAEVAQVEAATQARMQSVVGDQQAVIERTQNRLMLQSQKSNADKGLIEREAQRKLEQQRALLITEGKAAIETQKISLVAEAQDHVAQRQDALVYEAEQALWQKSQQEQAIEQKAEQMILSLSIEAEGTLMAKEEELVYLKNQLSNAYQQIEGQQTDYLQRNLQFQANQGDLQVHKVANTTLRQELGTVSERHQHEQNNWNAQMDQQKRIQAAQHSALEARNNVAQQALYDLNESNKELRQQIAQQKLDALKASEESKEAQRHSEIKMLEFQKSMEGLQLQYQKLHSQKAVEFKIDTPRGAIAKKEEAAIEDPIENFSDDEDYGEEDDDYWQHPDEQEEKPGENLGMTDPGGVTDEPPPMVNDSPRVEHQVESVPQLRIREADECRFQKFPNQRRLRGWLLNTCKVIAGVSGRPKLAYAWISRTQFCTSLAELEDDKGFDSLSAKAAIGFYAILHGEFKRTVELIDEKRAASGTMLNGRQYLWLILEELKRTSDEKEITDFEDLMEIQLVNDNLRGFQTSWDAGLLRMLDPPKDKIKEVLYQKQILKSKEFEQTMSLYTMDIAQNKAERSYPKLYEMVNNFLESRRKQRNRDDGTKPDRDGWGAAGKGSKGGGKGKDGGGKGKKGGGKGRDPNAPPKQNGDCINYYNYGRCADFKNCPYHHDRTAYPKGKGSKGKSKGDSKGKGGKNRSNSERPPRGRAQERDSTPRKDKRGTSPSGVRDAKPCRAYLQGKCTFGSDCKLWHAPQCTFYQAGTCTLGPQCPFLHGNPKKALAAAKAKPKAKGKAKATEPEAEAEARPTTPRRKRKGRAAVAIGEAPSDQ